MRLVVFVLEEDVYSRMALPRGVPYALSTLTRYVLLLAGFLLALGTLGFDLGRVALVLSALGLGIGFGLQNVINNFVSGLILLFERPIQVGDTVQKGTLIGEVRRIGIRSSTVRTWEGAEVIVPNANLVSEEVVNWTLSDRNRRIDIEVGAAYGSDPEHVLEILRAAAKDHPYVLAEPAPMALFKGFGESSLDFELRVWTAEPERWMPTRSEIAVAIAAAFREAGIAIPFPQRDLHLVSVGDEAAARIARSPEHTPPKR
jgi:small-conductance mechanosensitive channel